MSLASGVNDSVEDHFSGLIDDVTLYDTLLSSDHISAIDEINRTPDTIPEPEVQSVETEPEQTGTENEYGFVTEDDDPDDQKIEEVAAEGYKVKKPEDKKKKDKQVETPENQSSDKADAAKENNPSSADKTIKDTENDITQDTTNDTTQDTTNDTTQDTTNDTAPLDESGTVDEFDNAEISTSSVTSKVTLT